jgi:hypothetical protein
MSRLVLVASYSAVGGPEKSGMGSDGFGMGPTTAGEYVVAYCSKHVSRRYPEWSSIPWGAPLKEEAGELVVEMGGRWRRVFEVTGGVTKQDVLNYHKDLYFVRTVPATWVFNDFGHLTCYIFKDSNHDGRLDPARGERIQGQFFHTTPQDEADTALRRPVRLGPSHGCVHLKPLELDDMVKRGYMRKGVKVVVHSYSDHLIKYPSGHGSAPFELHFFPGLSKLVVVGKARSA